MFREMIDGGRSVKEVTTDVPESSDFPPVPTFSLVFFILSIALV